MIGVTQLQRAMDWNGTCLILYRSNGNAMVALRIVVSTIDQKIPKITINFYYLLLILSSKTHYANFCILVPGKTRKTGRNSCSHQLCECDREFAMCLHKHLPCPKSKAACKNKKRLWQNLLMGLTSGHGMHHPHKSGAKYFPKKPSKHYQHHTPHQHRERPRTLNTHFNPFKIFG